MESFKSVQALLDEIRGEMREWRSENQEMHKRLLLNPPIISNEKKTNISLEESRNALAKDGHFFQPEDKKPALSKESVDLASRGDESAVLVSTVDECTDLASTVDESVDLVSTMDESTALPSTIDESAPLASIVPHNGNIFPKFFSCEHINEFAARWGGCNASNDDDGMSIVEGRDYSLVIRYDARADLCHLFQFLAVKQVDAPQVGMSIDSPDIRKPQWIAQVLGKEVSFRSLSDARKGGVFYNFKESSLCPVFSVFGVCAPMQPYMWVNYLNDNGVLACVHWDPGGVTVLIDLRWRYLLIMMCTGVILAMRLKLSKSGSSNTPLTTSYGATYFLSMDGRCCVCFLKLPSSIHTFRKSIICSVCVCVCWNVFLYVWVAWQWVYLNSWRLCDRTNNGVLGYCNWDPGGVILAMEFRMLAMAFSGENNELNVMNLCSWLGGIIIDTMVEANLALDDVKRVFEFAKSDLGFVDIWINKAGTVCLKSLIIFSIADAIQECRKVVRFKIKIVSLLVSGKRTVGTTYMSRLGHLLQSSFGARKNDDWLTPSAVIEPFEARAAKLSVSCVTNNIISSQLELTAAHKFDDSNMSVKEKGILKKAQFGLKGTEKFADVEWFNSRLSRAARDDYAEMLGILVADKTVTQFTRDSKWFIWKLEGDPNLGNYMDERVFLLNLEYIMFGQFLKEVDSSELNRLAIKQNMGIYVLGNNVREEMDTNLFFDGSNSSLVTDPTKESFRGDTITDLAYMKGHDGLAATLAEKDLATHFKDMSLFGNISGSLDSSDAILVKLENVNDKELCMQDSLAAYHRAAEALTRLQAPFREQIMKLKSKAVQLEQIEVEVSHIVVVLKIQHVFVIIKCKKSMAAAVLIQHIFRSWKIRRNFLNMCRQAVRIQVVFRGHMVRRQHIRRDYYSPDHGVEVSGNILTGCLLSCLQLKNKTKVLLSWRNCEVNSAKAQHQKLLEIWKKQYSNHLYDEVEESFVDGCVGVNFLVCGNQECLSNALFGCAGHNEYAHIHYKNGGEFFRMMFGDIQLMLCQVTPLQTTVIVTTQKLTFIDVIKGSVRKLSMLKIACIALVEFRVATVHMNRLERKELLVAAFSYFDKDGSGYITLDEFQQDCNDHNMTDVFLDGIIKEVAQDNDGRIEYGEFVARMQKGNGGIDCLCPA